MLKKHRSNLAAKKILPGTSFLRPSFLWRLILGRKKKRKNQKEKKRKNQKVLSIMAFCRWRTEYELRVNILKICIDRRRRKPLGLIILFSSSHTSKAGYSPRLKAWHLGPSMSGKFISDMSFCMLLLVMFSIFVNEILASTVWFRLR